MSPLPEAKSRRSHCPGVGEPFAAWIEARLARAAGHEPRAEVKAALAAYAEREGRPYDPGTR